MNLQSESQLQAQCFQWHWNTYPQYRGALFHVPNGGVRSKVQAMQFKAMGVIAGVPDLLLILPNGKLHAFELKTSTGRLSPVQVSLHTQWGAWGVAVTTIRSLQDFQQHIRGIYTWL